MYQIIKEALKFGVVGILSTAITYGVYLLLVNSFTPTISYLIAYVVGILANFLMNIKYTFKTTTSVKKGIGFIICHAINLGLSVGLLNLFVHLGMSKTLAPIPMYAICVPVNFLLVRIVLKKDENGYDEEV